MLITRKRGAAAAAAVFDAAAFTSLMAYESPFGAVDHKYHQIMFADESLRLINRLIHWRQV